MAKDKKGKQEKPKKEGRKISALYNTSGEKVERKNRTCPKCGPGMFLGTHKNRVTCGNCHYTEFSSKNEDSDQESSKDQE